MREVLESCSHVLGDMVAALVPEEEGVDSLHHLAGHI